MPRQDASGKDGWNARQDDDIMPSVSTTAVATLLLLPWVRGRRRRGRTEEEEEQGDDGGDDGGIIIVALLLLPLRMEPKAPAACDYVRDWYRVGISQHQHLAIARVRAGHNAMVSSQLARASTV